MNGDFLEICDSAFPAVVGTGLRKAVTVVFQDSVAAAYARRHVMYTISILQRLDALAGRPRDTQRVDKRAAYRELVTCCERELLGKIEKAARDADARGCPPVVASDTTVTCVFAARSVDHLSFVNLFLLLDRLACQVRRMQRARELNLQDASSVVHSGKCALKDLAKKLENLTIEAEQELGEGLTRYYYLRSLSTVHPLEGAPISERRKRRLDRAIAGPAAPALGQHTPSGRN